MEKVCIEPGARFKLERLCDRLHPQEVGGYLLGEIVDSEVIVKDVFPVPNTSDSKNTRFKDHPWGNHWVNLYAKTVDLSLLNNFKFHSHPNGTIPSAGDMKACPDLHLWIIHHAQGQHTYRASKDYQDREVLLLNETRESMKLSRFIGDRYQLGTILIDNLGRLEIDPISKKLMKLKPETRRILLLAWRNIRYDNIELDKVVHQSGKTKSTVRKHLNICIKKGLLKKSWSRGNYKIIRR